tara:strand:+ start:1565 stop:2809 length:1245 start_codon:yes stop_codon:yes gene_type:complete
MNFIIEKDNKSIKSKLSPFAPKIFKNFKPLGINFFSFYAGFKKKNNDLLIIVFKKEVNTHCIYSITSTPSAPIIWDKKHFKGKCKAVIINSGNANAHTGKEGIKIIDQYVIALKEKLGCKKNQILVSSTGVIGEIFNPQFIMNPIKVLEKSRPTDLLSAAKTIMTTDTYPKTSVKNIKIKNQNIKIYGFAKGSGMIQPNMGTMLVYIFIECYLNNYELKKLINDNIDDSFNSISVDSDTSTSDTLMLFSSSKKKINIKVKKNYQLLSNCLSSVMKDLANQVVKDGEGLSKIIEVTVIKAKTKIQAKNIAFSVINSPLVKTAIAGEDANWGRIIMAIGKTYEKIDQNKIQVSFGNNIVCANGEIYKKINLSSLNKYMKKNMIRIKINLEIGKFSKTVTGNDLTHQYININADYRS